MSKKKKANRLNNNARGNNADANNLNINNPNESNSTQNANPPSLRDEKNKRRHDNIKKEDSHRWPKQL